MHVSNTYSFRRGVAASFVGALVLPWAMQATPAFADVQQSGLLSAEFDPAAVSEGSDEGQKPLAKVYTISLACSAGGYVGVAGENGDILPLGDSVEVQEGSSQSFVIVPEQGFVVGSIVYGDEIREGMLNSFTVTPSADTTLSVTFISEEEAGLTDYTPGFHKTESGAIYYRNEEGRLAFGRVTLDGGTYVFRCDGTALVGWQTMSEGRFFFGLDGRMRTGWETIGTEKYFFDLSGVALTGWQQLDNLWYYFRAGGSMALCVEDGPKTGWTAYNGSWYWFDADGVLKTGWQYIGEKWYYLRPNGTMVTGWQVVDGKWYYFGTSGTMHRGWVFVDGWYYLGTNGAMRSGWFWVDDAWYATTKEGRCLMDTWGNDGSDYDYYFGPTGAWTGQQRKHVG